MRKYIFVLLSLLCALCITAASYAAEAQKPSSGNLQLLKASKSLQITGTVTSVNEAAGTVSVTKKVKGKSTEVTAVADRETKIVKGDEKMSLHDIRAGDKVAVVYIREDGVNLAKSIFLK